MSKLEELIQKLCPNGVEYKAMDELGYFYGGLSGKSRDDFVDGNAKFITYKNIYSNLALNLAIDDKVKIDENENQNTIQYGDVLFTGSSETPDECGFSSVLTTQTEEKLYLNSFCFGYRFFDKSTFLPDFSKYFFRSQKLRTAIGKTASGVTRFNVSKKKMGKIKIPVPPIEVQEEIVRILDKFTELSAELTAELSSRKKQYEFYRDELLNFSDRKDIKFLPVSELFEFKNGLNKGKEFFGKGIPIVNFTDVFKNRWLTKEMLKGRVTLSPAEIERYSAKKGDVFFTRTSETQEEIGMTSVLLEDIENCVFSGFVLRARPKTKLLLPKFCSYYFSAAHIRMQIIKNSTFTTRALTSGPKLSKILVPILSFEEQLRLTTILDNFHSLVTDISEGLPAEIEARQKQYEYYRDKLLTFKEKTICG